MVRHSYVIKLLVFSVFVTGCQKAKMTHSRPTAEQNVHYDNGQVVPENQAPDMIPVDGGSQDDFDREDDVRIGRDPIPKKYIPSKETPIPDSGEPIDENIFSQNGQAGARPDVDGINNVEWFESNSVDPVLKKCGNCEEEKPAQVIEKPVHRPIEKPKPVAPTVHQCTPENVSGVALTEKIDILFVTDTSASLKEERSQIAEQMGQFIDRLKPNVDYQIAVMPAHGPSTQKSQTNFYGELFSQGAGDAPVIKFRGLHGKPAVIQDLKSKMLALPKDSSDAQGEAGLLSLYRSLMDPKAKGLMEAQGFLRADAALAVIFVSDENDVCYDYAKYGGSPNFNGSGKRDPHEQKIFDSVCKLSTGDQLRPEHVVKALELAKGEMPVIMTGILYTSNNIPKKSDKYAQENEMGRGYLDAIRVAQGKAVDLGQRNFGAALAQLGDYSQFRMEFNNSFVCRTNIPTEQINLDSFRITVNSKGGKKLGEFASSCEEDASLCPAGTHPAAVGIYDDGTVKLWLSLEEFQRIAEPGAVLRATFR